MSTLPVQLDPSATPEQQFTVLWQRFYERWQVRNERMEKIDKVYTGDWTVFAPDDEVLDPKSPNLIQVALDDTAESAASFQPTVRVTPSKTTQGAKDAAAVMEQLGASYMDRSEFSLLAMKSMKNLLAYGMFSWVVTWNAEEGPKIEWRDPRSCYPEPDQSSLGVTRRCFFARDMYETQLPDAWRKKFEQHCLANQVDNHYFGNHAVTIVEYYDCDRVIVAGVYDANVVPTGGVTRLNNEPSYVSVILEDYENPLDICPVVIGQRVQLDQEPRGQFDQVVGVLQAHFDLMALVIDYADQSVHSDVWVKDLIGEMSIGGGSYIQLGPQGAIGRLQPAVTSLSLFNEMQGLLDSVHIGGRWPKSRMGEVDQSIASAKFIESTVGIMNQVIDTSHKIMRRALEQAQRVCFKADKLCGPSRTVAGILRNQQFLMERKVGDIDLAARVRMDYGLGLGRDNAQSMVLGIQGLQTGLFSLEFVQENFDGITDVALERRRLDVQQFKDIMMGLLLKGSQEGTISPAQLIAMAKDRNDGEDLMELFKKYIADPQQAQADAAITSGMDGSQMQPGAPPALGAGSAPTPPPPEDIMSMLGGQAGRQPPEMIARQSIPLGDGSFMGAQSTSAP